VHRALAAAPAQNRALTIRHPGGVGDILHSADGGSWLGGAIDFACIHAPGVQTHESVSELAVVALA
jgi:hypothetical protein